VLHPAVLPCVIVIVRQGGNWNWCRVTENRFNCRELGEGMLHSTDGDSGHLFIYIYIYMCVCVMCGVVCVCGVYGVCGVCAV